MITAPPRRWAALIGLLLVLGCVLLGGCVLPMGEAQRAPEPSAPGAVLPARVSRVVDGDTVAVRAVPGVLDENSRRPGEHLVRLLGIDAPEMHYHSTESPECGARAASDHLETLLPAGERVRLVFDLRADHRDRFDRSLAYLEAKTGTDVGLAQVAAGYAAPWFPTGEPEPVRVPVYRDAAQRAAQDHRGAHAVCVTVGRD